MFQFFLSLINIASFQNISVSFRKKFRGNNIENNEEDFFSKLIKVKNG